MPTLAAQSILIQAGTLAAELAARPTVAENLAESYRHGQATAHLLAGWRADPELQAAGLCHAFVWQEPGILPQVAAGCGPRVAFLTGEYGRILQQTPASGWRGKENVLKRVKLFMAAYCDPALAFLGAACLWDTFNLARQQADPTRQRVVITETKEVLIPLLSMLGMWELKEEAEEWVMQHGPDRESYDYLSRRLAQTEDLRRRVFELVRSTLQPVMFSARLTRRPRTPVQVYSPHLLEKAHPEALQKLTVDLLVDTEEECYQALRWIHHFWQPLEASLRDYVGTSKLNGYRCLQTGVTVLLGAAHVRVDFHIRTWEMDEINRWGLAAIELRHRYQPRLPQAWWSQRAEHYAHLTAAPIGALPKMLYVFSPQGQVFGFHQGCTVVDYAYHVHSELAHQCKRFRVNGDVVSPVTPLHHLDLVELEYDPQFPGPNRTWLNAARTERARSSIQRFLRRHDQGWLAGQTVLERRLRALEEYYRLDIPEYRVQQALNQAARQAGFERLEDLLAEIAAGRLTSDRFLHPLFAEEITRQVQLPPELRLYPHQLSLARCCKPRPGDQIVGRSRSRGGEVLSLKIHQANCPHLRGFSDLIPLGWRLQPPLSALARLELTGLDEDGLLGDALGVIYACLPQVMLHQVEAAARGGVANLSFTVEAKDQGLIDQITHNLEQLPGRIVNEVRQMQLLFSEREELLRPAGSAGFNPYRRLPVKEREMFFGRAEELARIADWLRAGVGVIFIRGQKRVGKTSLLLHLRQHYLARHSLVPVFVDFQILGHLNGPELFYELAQAVYTDLHLDGRLNNASPPLRELFETAAPTQLADYLHGLQSHFGPGRLVLLLDEFSRTMDAYQQGQLDPSFFYNWRGLLHATTPEVSYILVVQQQTYDNLLEQMAARTVDPSWHLLEMGEILPISPLSEKDARQLIERPTHNYLEYPPELLHQVWRLTGGSPFLIQAFCFNLVRHIARTGRRRVDESDVKLVQTEFMHPDEHLFAHLLDMLRGVAHPICRQLALLSDETDQPVPTGELQAALPEIPLERLLNTLARLVDQHILVQPEPGKWQFASLLFSRWLAINSAPAHFGPIKAPEETDGGS